MQNIDKQKEIQQLYTKLRNIEKELKNINKAIDLCSSNSSSAQQVNMFHRHRASKLDERANIVAKIQLLNGNKSIQSLTARCKNIFSR